MRCAVLTFEEAAVGWLLAVVSHARQPALTYSPDRLQALEHFRGTLTRERLARAPDGCRLRPFIT